MYKYQIIIYWSEADDCYIAEVPELAGCMSDGKTPDEAVKNTQIVIKEWIETAKERGQEIPSPKGKLQLA
ncbi:MAG: type II toxin-antitoxin system HicB family antitoxin [Firmicutes bacterium]|nr:type II toxin-antitoxin system HicB family antitoxin [Bacillota bacterium]